MNDYLKKIDEFIPLFFKNVIKKIKQIGNQLIPIILYNKNHIKYEYVF